MNNINIVVEVQDSTEPRELMTKFGTKTTLVNATLKDETGTVNLVLWGKQSDGIAKGKKIEIKNAFSKEFRNELQLGLSKQGEIKFI
ncbi:MAG: hypothetical protein ABIB46_00525 [bacterium]